MWINELSLAVVLQFPLGIIQWLHQIANKLRPYDGVELVRIGVECTRMAAPGWQELKKGCSNLFEQPLME